MEVQVEASRELLPPFVPHRFLLAPLVVSAPPPSTLQLDRSPSPPPSPTSSGNVPVFPLKPRSAPFPTTALHQPFAVSFNTSYPDATFSSSSLALHLPIDEEETITLIKSVTIPHHAKMGGKWLFACRVVPETVLPISRESPDDSGYLGSLGERKGSLGRMALAGTSESKEVGPYTVWRCYSEFVDLSQK